MKNQEHKATLEGCCSPFTRSGLPKICVGWGA